MQIGVNFRFFSFYGGCGKMKVIKNINNNISLCLDSRNNEVVAFGKGIGFTKPPYDVPLSKIDRTFYDVDEEQLAVLNRIPENVLEAAAEIGKQALNILKKRLDIALPREEAAAIALHFVNYKAQAETTPDIDYGSIIEQATGIIEQELQVTVDRDSFNYYRFVTHMHYMMKRTLDDAMIDTQNRDIFESMKKEYPSIYSCSVKVAALIEQQLKKSLSEEEILYLILHINRLCAREDCDR